MARRDFITKWGLYALGLVPVLILEFVILNRVPVFGVVPMLLPVCAAVVAGLEGAPAGAGFGLAVGILADAIYPGVPGGMTLGLTLIGVGAGVVTRYGLRQSFLGCFLSALISLVAIDAVRVLWFLFERAAPLPVLLSVAGREVAWSLAFVPVIYLIFRAIHRRVPA